MSASPATPIAPRTVLIVKTDTLGDLVLLAPTLCALRDAWPSTRLCVLIRAAYADIAPLVVRAAANRPAIEWLTTTIDPFAQGPDECTAELARLRDAVTALAPDVVVAATSRRHWLEPALASAAPAHARRVAVGSAETDPFFTVKLRLLHGYRAAEVFPEVIDTAAHPQDWQKNLCLADALLGHPVTRVAPALRLDAAARERAAAELRARGLTPGRYVVCAAAGFANVAIKTWPADNFGAAIRHISERHQLPTLLIGHESERAHLESVRAQVGQVSDLTGQVKDLPYSDTPVWLGGNGDLPLLAALIAEARLFLGNDTGAMHLAAALDVPLVAVFGGGTWPRFVPAARRGVSVVQPLPCFGCGWDCAFGDAPCVKVIAVADVTGAVDDVLARLARGEQDFSMVREVENLAPETREMMGAAAARHRAATADLVLRQQQIEEKDDSILEKEREIDAKEAEIHSKQQEIDALKAVCDEREKTIFTLDANVRAVQSQLATAQADNAQLAKTFAELPADSATAAKALADSAIHIRNIESLLGARALELAELKATAANRAAGLHDLEQAKHYSRLLAEKEAVIQSLRRGHAERENVIRELSAGTTGVTAKLRKLWIAASAHLREKWWRPFDAWLFKKVVEEYWMQIGVLRHYDPRPLRWDSLPGPRRADATLPQIGLVTPSYGQEKFIERTMLSVLDQHYPKLLYVVQDGGSKDCSAEIIARHAGRLRHWESARDEGQADAVRRGFVQLETALGPNDIMAWLNSDDLLAPGALRFVAEYFAAHPDVDAVYGHRIIIDNEGSEIGRWIMPRHNPATLEWIDYVPQETLFWRKRAWDLVGGIDPSFQFALDWDLLARFQQAGRRIVRVPYFLGAFRVHAAQKTSQDIHTTGADEMRRIRTRFHGANQDDFATIDQHARDARFWGAITARLHAVGIRW
jgi:ADP-heptose:LPS heptosyltransferase